MHSYYKINTNNEYHNEEWYTRIHALAAWPRTRRLSLTAASVLILPSPRRTALLLVPDIETCDETSGTSDRQAIWNPQLAAEPAVRPKFQMLYILHILPVYTDHIQCTK
jgi:hypothetical protein